LDEREARERTSAIEARRGLAQVFLERSDDGLPVPLVALREGAARQQPRCRRQRLIALSHLNMCGEGLEGAAEIVVEVLLLLEVLCDLGEMRFVVAGIIPAGLFVLSVTPAHDDEDAG